MLTSHFLAIRLLHVVCVALSGGLFLARGLLRLSGRTAANDCLLRYLSYGIDTALLGSALLLMAIVHQYPLRDAWLTVKLGLLVLYVGFGSLALKRARSRRAQAVALIAALVTFAYMLGVAVTRDPAGWLSLRRP